MSGAAKNLTKHDFRDTELIGSSGSDWMIDGMVRNTQKSNFFSVESTDFHWIHDYFVFVY